MTMRRRDKITNRRGEIEDLLALLDVIVPTPSSYYEIEFFVDGVKFGEDATAPFNPWMRSLRQ